MVFARRLLKDLRYKVPSDDPRHGKSLWEQRSDLALPKGAKSIGDLRVIEMYEAAIREDLPLADRGGNWVQEVRTDEDALLFATAQFSRFQEVEALLKENLAARAEVADLLRARGTK